jgi:hypothetical protein
MGKTTIREVGKGTREGSGEPENLDGGQAGGNKETVSDSINNNEFSFNPSDFNDAASDTSKPGYSDGGDFEQPKRKRRGKQAKKETAANLTQIILQSHVMLAALLDTEELLLNPQEASNMANAIQRVEALYEKSFLSEEASAWINLTIVAATTYGPRYMAVRARQAQEAREKRAKEPIDVAPLSTSFDGINGTARPS